MARCWSWDWLLSRVVGRNKGTAENAGAKIDKAAGDVGKKANEVEKKSDKAVKDAKKKADKEDSE